MHESHRIDTALRDSMNALHGSAAWREGQGADLLISLLKKRTDNHSSVAKLRIRHVRAFVLSVCVRGVAACVQRTQGEKEKKSGTERRKRDKARRKREKGARERERKVGQHYLAIKSLG